MTFKAIASSFLVSMVRNYVRIYRQLLSRQQKEILVAPPASAGSLGDQALLQGLHDGLCREWNCHLRQVLLPNYEAIQLQNEGSSTIGIHGGTLSDLRLLLAFRNARLFCVLGADVIDGRYDEGQALYYLHALDLAASAGVPSRLFGFSFSEEPNPRVVDRFKSLAAEIVCCARDPVSRRRFTDFTGREARQVADLAFQVAAKAASTSALHALEWIRHEKQGGARVVALNGNILTNPSDPDRIKIAYVELINELASKDSSLRFVLVPHDFRGKESDHLCHSRILAELGEMAKKRTFLLEPPLHAWDAKAVAAASDLVVTGRMHFAIAALGSGVPAIGIGYMGKFEGLLGYFDLKSLLITPQSAYNDLMLPVKVLEALPQLSIYREQIAQHIGAVKNLSKENFSGL